MSQNMNRFAMLSMDDDSGDELQQISKVEHVEQAPVVVPVLVERPDATRKWNLHQAEPSEKREWNIERTNPIRRMGPFSRYAFRDEDRSRPPPRLHRYAFRDESPPAESKKPVTPVYESLVKTPTYPPMEEPVALKDEEFPKLSDYTRPMTPPYPPDDGYYPTLAERVKNSIERKETAESKEEKRTFTMDTMIPLSTGFIKNILLE
jgi:hypothetical protein